MAIAPITLGDTQSRAKINAAIDQANLVPTKAAIADMRALPTRLPHRPGEAREAFTRSTAGGPAENLPIFESAPVLGPRGFVFQAVGADQVVQRAYTAIEPGRSYLVRASYSRAANASDPANDAIRVALIWYDQARNPLVATPYTVVIDDLGLTTGSGLKKVSKVIATAAGDNIDIIAPAGAVYARATVVTFGGEQRTNIEILTIVDVSDATLYSPALSSLEARVTAQESLNLGPRQDVVEAAVNTPKSVTYATMLDAKSANVPATAGMVILLSHSLPGLGGARYQRAVSGEFQSADGAWWRLAQGQEIRPEIWGALGDDDALDLPAFVAARDWLRDHPGHEMRLKGQYWLGEAAVDISGIRIVTEPGARLRGGIDLTKENIDVPNGLDIRIDSYGVTYDYPLSRSYKKPFAAKSIWLQPGFRRDKYDFIDAGSFLKESVSTSGDSFSADGLPIASPDTISWSLSSGDTSAWHCATLPLCGGQELNAAFGPGAFKRAAIVIHSGGRFGIHAGATGQATLFSKPIGGSLTETALTWLGSDNHPQWLPANCLWTVRVYDRNTAAFLMNGFEVFRTNVGGELITQAGYAVCGTGSAVQAGLTGISRRSARDFDGQPSTVVMVFSDSNSSPKYGNWIPHMREGLDGDSGIRVADIINHAVPGHGTSNQRAIMESAGLGYANYIVMWVGSGNIQQGSPISSSIADMIWMLDKCNAEGRRPVVVIQPLWLSPDQAPGGFVAPNAEKGAELRARMIALAAQKGALIVDVQQILGQILSYYFLLASISDGRVMDGIHLTAFANLLVGRAIAAAIAGDLVRLGTAAVDAWAMADRYFANGWYTTAQRPRLTVTAERDVTIDGVLEAGTKSNGTAIITLPANMRPNRTSRFDVRSVRVIDGRLTPIRLILEPDGNVKVYDMPSDDTQIILNNVRYRAA